MKGELFQRTKFTIWMLRYLEYAADYICEFLRARKVEEVLFVPYALRDQVGGYLGNTWLKIVIFNPIQDGYTAKARSVFETWGFRLSSVHEAENPAVAAANAQVENVAKLDPQKYN